MTFKITSEHPAPIHAPFHCFCGPAGDRVGWSPHDDRAAGAAWADSTQRPGSNRRTNRSYRVGHAMPGMRDPQKRGPVRDVQRGTPRVRRDLGVKFRRWSGVFRRGAGLGL